MEKPTVTTDEGKVLQATLIALEAYAASKNENLTAEFIRNILEALEK